MKDRQYDYYNCSTCTYEYYKEMGLVVEADPTKRRMRMEGKDLWYVNQGHRGGCRGLCDGPNWITDRHDYRLPRIPQTALGIWRTCFPFKTTGDVDKSYCVYFISEGINGPITWVGEACSPYQRYGIAEQIYPRLSLFD